VRLLGELLDQRALRLFVQAGRGAVLRTKLAYSRPPGPGRRASRAAHLLAEVVDAGRGVVLLAL
jgi:hypothetical protein